MDSVKKDIDNLFDEFESSDLYTEYLAIKKQLEENHEITNMISDIKRLQKINANNKDTMIEEEIKKLYIKLESYPIYKSYLNITNEISDELFWVKEAFDKYFQNILKLE